MPTTVTALPNEVAHRVGALRVWYAQDPDARAVRFAIELNSAALDRWPEQKAAQYLDESADLLLVAAHRNGLSMGGVHAITGVLGNRCQLRVDRAADPAGDLADAIAAGQTAVSFLRETIEAHAASREPNPEARAEIESHLVESLAHLARALSDAAQLDDAEAAISEAEELTLKVTSTSSIPPQIVADLEQLVRSARQYVAGEVPDLNYSIWLGRASAGPDTQARVPA